VDYDNDGRLDVYATNRNGPNSLYRNAGDSFTRVSGGPDDPGPTVGSCWFDMDRDGDLDVFHANQSGAADAMWRNDGSSFTDVAPALGMTGPPRDGSGGGVGCAVGDYDNDGHLDLFIASYVGSTPDQQPVNAFFRNDGTGHFVDVLSRESPINAADHSVQFVDDDGDGGLDVSLTDTAPSGSASAPSTPTNTSRRPSAPSRRSRAPTRRSCRPEVDPDMPDPGTRRAHHSPRRPRRRGRPRSSHAPAPSPDLLAPKRLHRVQP
jgi:hypothetical protein